MLTDTNTNGHHDHEHEDDHYMHQVRMKPRPRHHARQLSNPHTIRQKPQNTMVAMLLEVRMHWTVILYGRL